MSFKITSKDIVLMSVYNSCKTNNKRDKYLVSKYLCADLTNLNISGIHTCRQVSKDQHIYLLLFSAFIYFHWTWLLV